MSMNQKRDLGLDKTIAGRVTPELKKASWEAAGWSSGFNSPQVVRAS